MIPIELAVATTVGLTSIAFIGMLIAGVSVFKTKKKKSLTYQTFYYIMCK